jgi:hypothetical protein
MFGAVALMRQPVPNTNRAMVKVMRWPRTSISQELSSIVVDMVARKPVAIHCAWSSPTPNAPITDGTATFTMEDANPMAIAPVMTVKVTSQR